MKVRWGILSVAAIGLKKVIPAMQRCQEAEIVAIASRDAGRAAEAARSLGIPKAYGTYEELLQDPDVEVIYNPLPNHMHVEWTLRAAEAGKHVLCEKPLTMTVEEARQLLAVRDRTGVKIGEAFMVRTHPQWLRAKELVESGVIGDLRSIMSFFSYSNRDPQNIRNILAYGGGGLMDIGCYTIFTSRFIFGEEPRRVAAIMEFDPDMHTDRLTSAILDYPSGQAIFTCSTQLVPYQRVQIFGTKGRIEIEIPFNAPPDRPTRLWVDDGRDLFGSGIRAEQFDTCDQYTVQGDAFSRAVFGEAAIPVPLETALGNMKAIEAVARAASSGRWENVG
jgi:predicted dehydrogenase